MHLGECGLDVVGDRVFGGEDLVAGLDLDGVVAAQGGDELIGAPSGRGFEPAGDGECREHDGQVGVDRIDSCL